MIRLKWHITQRPSSLEKGFDGEKRRRGLGLAARLGLGLGSIRMESMGASLEDLKARLGTKTSIDVVDTKLMVRNQPIC